MSLATKTALHTILTADDDFTDLLPGGVHYTVSEISLQATPEAFDANKEIRPCCLIRAESTTNIGPFRSSGRQFFVLVFYQRRNYDVVDAAAQLARELLNDKVFPEHGLVEVLHVDRIPDGQDTALGCSMYLDRYEVIRNIRSA